MDFGWKCVQPKHFTRLHFVGWLSVSMQTYDGIFFYVIWNITLAVQISNDERKKMEKKESRKPVQFSRSDA